MDNIERARELYRKLEESGSSVAAEVARRAFCIQDIMARN